MFGYLQRTEFSCFKKWLSCERVNEKKLEIMKILTSLLTVAFDDSKNAERADTKD